MIDIFIRTYKDDLEWLKYCLRSIHKNVTGFNKIIVCIPENQAHLLKPFNLTQEEVVTEEVWEDDYLGQQYSKLTAYKHSDADYILFIDSDMYAKEPVNLSEEFLKEGKPIIYKRQYDQAGDAICWKPITEKFIHGEVDFEYMCRLPMLYRNDTLSTIDGSYRIKRYLENQPYRQFSEFNAIGAWIEKCQPNDYHLLDIAEHPTPENKFVQNWSWGGLTPEVRAKIEEDLK